MSLTKAGLRLYGKIQRGECKLSITRVLAGQGEITDGEDITEFAALKDPVNVDIAITRNIIIGDGQTRIDITFGESETDYYLRELGIMATDPDEGEILYAYCNFGIYADFISAYSGQYTFTQEGILFFSIGNATEIEFDSGGTVQVSRAEFLAHTNNTENPHGVTAAQVGFTNKEILDTITEALIANWNESYLSRHEHNNKPVIDSITHNHITAWSYASEHIHKTTNPHNVTKTQIGLGNVPNMSAADIVKSVIGSSKVVKAVPPEYIGNMPTKYCIFVILWDEYDYDGQSNSDVYAYTMDLQTGTRYRAVEDSYFDFSHAHTWTALN